MNILIRATNWVGDAILALPAIRAVRLRFPDARIAIVARPYVADLYRDQHICDELIPYDTKGQHRGFRGRELLATQLRDKRFDVALLLQNAFDGAWLTWRAGIPERIGYARDARGPLLTKSIPVPRLGEIPSHEKFYYLELLHRAGWIQELHDIPRITLDVSDAARRRASQTLLDEGSSPTAVRIAVGAGASYGSAKCWPPHRFAEVLNQLRPHADLDVVLFGTPAESAVSDTIAAGLRTSPIDLTAKTAIADLPALLSQCHLFLGNDSGAMHVAAAVGLPVVAIFGPTDPLGTAPVTPRSTVVRQKPFCSPCFLRRCPIDHRCMTAVTPEMVHAAVLACLAEVRSA